MLDCDMGLWHSFQYETRKVPAHGDVLKPCLQFLKNYFVGVFPSWNHVGVHNCRVFVLRSCRKMLQECFCVFQRTFLLLTPKMFLGVINYWILSPLYSWYLTAWYNFS